MIVMFTYVQQTADQANIVAFIDGELHVAHSTQPNFEEIKALLVDGAGEVEDTDALRDLFDPSKRAAEIFEALGDRVSVKGGVIYLDGDAVHNSLSDQVIRFMREGVEGWQPLVKFFEKVQSNPNEHSREQLYSWLTSNEFSIADDGDIVGYRGVSKDDEGRYWAGHRGQAIVNGVPVNGAVENPVGGVVEMARSEVNHDPTTGCSTGLHVSNYAYAQSYGSSTLEVRVNPRDVVSVPTESGWQKVRVCRFTVVDEVEAPHGSAVVFNASASDFDEIDDETCEECEEYSEDCCCEDY